MSEQTPSPARRPRDPLGWQLLLLAFLVGVGGALYLALVPKPSRTALVPVPVTDLSAYHVIQATNLTTATLELDSIPENTFHTASDLVGRYTLVPLPANRLVTVEQVHAVPDPMLISDTVPIGIPATPAMVLGGNLQAGDVVDLILVSVTTEADFSPTPTLFENVLVLDVRPALESQATNSKPSDHPFTVVIALPLDRRVEFATSSAGAKLLISRNLRH